jgi:hypothetical protein
MVSFIIHLFYYIRMARYFLILCFLFLSLNLHAQSYLGKNKEEIYELVKARSKKAILEYASDSLDAQHPYIKVSHHYETLYYYLEDDVCVKFEVVKPYSCNCLDTDLKAYQQNCIAVGDLKWVDKEYTNIFKMTMYEKEYKLSITPAHNPKTSQQASTLFE